MFFGGGGAVSSRRYLNVPLLHINDGTVGRAGVEDCIPVRFHLSA